MQRPNKNIAQYSAQHSTALYTDQRNKPCTDGATHDPSRSRRARKGRPPNDRRDTLHAEQPPRLASDPGSGPQTTFPELSGEIPHDVHAAEIIDTISLEEEMHAAAWGVGMVWLSSRDTSDR
ncbi:hypothetical protein EYC84_005822 [Monilinia fructicola]|uniref:Uncharacterized protein n=1 Tax=Monilinia fructicola TaxID=38448 RepID=A0A5M9K6B1_MONFR|nr:hypothetical protein EYC84_005822 [Monilinia fructicola]